ncbi:D-glycero-alpha-D-manno-heptose 7-phosphate kinase [Clostridium tepidiprofundi DSM 19306]|uniref:D-glycero-alpha-D-manno-heptose 7-phosphate kinase n=1 Tax=Clostridium tepidiprofundi DSM 19306 TaxID=1121338 RepID=A0A151B488_9CLOT|nr:dehydrogenase [Clostridium tepidiprofundi]KYH34467.1 D-glycero-alpha-D-manno-heptose 7-phosphate kinase [Clostridium tepidiprofundi DSM 19306]
MIIRSKAPLRLGFAGGGTDVSPYSDQFGGYVLNATIDMYAYCIIEPNNSNRIIFNAVDRKEYFENESVERLDINGILALHKGVYNRIVKDYNNGQPLSLKITTYSDAPAGSGLGSSSTMVVAIIKAFVEYLNLPLGEYDIARLAYEIERKDIGLNGGKQDQYAATFGGFNFMEFYGDDKVIVNPLRIKNWILDELESSLVLYYTGVSRESSKIIDEQSKNVKAKNLKSVEALHQLKEDALRMKESILRGDILKFAEVLGKSWEAKKKVAKSISNESIDRIYNSAIEAGAYSGKVSGAGGGGFMMFVVDPIRKLEVIEQLNKFDGKVMNCHFVKDGIKGWRI